MNGKPVEIRIPAEYLKTFHKELRWFPHDGSPYGYIMFDTKMLVSILRNNDAKVRADAAKNLENLMDSGASYVMMGKSAGQAMR